MRSFLKGREKGGGAWHIYLAPRQHETSKETDGHTSRHRRNGRHWCGKEKLKLWKREKSGSRGTQRRTTEASRPCLLWCRGLYNGKKDAWARKRLQHEALHCADEDRRD